MPDSNPKQVSQDKKDNNYIENICRPKEWEKYLHAMNYGRIYYWQDNAKVKPIHFETYQYEMEAGNWVEEDNDLDSLQGTDWYNDNFNNADYGGYTKYSKSKKIFLIPKENNQDIVLDIAKDFKAENKEERTSKFLKYPNAKIWTDTLKVWWK